EYQENAGAAAKEDVAVALPRDLFQLQNAGVEGFRRVEVVRVECGFEDTFDRGGHGKALSQAIACFCMATRSAMPARASAIRLETSSSVNGLPSAVPWISTMPPEPVMTKLASVSAAESSRW